MSPAWAPPAVCGLALKEWASVCAALLAGKQRLLLRAGGIDDPIDDVWREGTTFWLYPTRFHEPAHGLRPGVELEALETPPAGTVDLPGLAVIEDIDFVGEESGLERLRRSHILNEVTVRQRFHYRRPGLSVITLGVYRTEPRRIIERPQYAGCKSWVRLDRPLPTGGLVAVAPDPELP